MNKILYKYLGFDANRHSLKTELFAGFSTFMVMAYILALAPSAFQGIGGEEDPFPTSALFAAIAIVACISTLLMAFYARRPLAIAPGVGLLFFITGTVCNTMGYSWHFALTAILLEGFLFTICSLTGISKIFARTIPVSLRSAIAVGVGLFLASLGLKSAGIDGSQPAIISLVDIVTAPEKQLLMFCVVLSGILLVMKVRGAIFLSLIASTLLGIPMGLTHFDEVISIPESPLPLFCQFDLSSDVFSVDMIACVVSIFFMDIFDTIGTTVGALSGTEYCKSNQYITGMNRILIVDSIASFISGIFGTTPGTTYLESAAGVTEGGRTGLTAFVTSICFIICLAFSPIFLAIPAPATGGILVIVSIKMFGAIRGINFTNPLEAIPSVLIILFMALVGSICDGIVVGVLSYAILVLAEDVADHLAKQRAKKKNNKK